MNYLDRLKKLSQSLSTIPFEALLIEHPVDILYLTGLEISTGRLLLTATDFFLVVDGRYFEMCQRTSPCPVLRSEQFKLPDYLSLEEIKSLAFDSEKTSYQTFLNMQKSLQELTALKLIPVDAPLRHMRLIKDREEREILKEAARLGIEGYEWVVSHLKEGISEAELALGLEFFWKGRGAKKFAFEPIIAFGANSSMPHYRAGDTKLISGMTVLIDIGVVWKHYHSDMTRVVFFGEPDPKISEIYSIVHAAKEQALALCRPGTPIGKLDQVAREYIANKGYGEYFSHSLGHGLGLDIHEPPTIRSQGAYSAMVLEPGMAITIEPGIYLPHIGGVRLEDTILITPNGYENLTVFINALI